MMPGKKKKEKCKYERGNYKCIEEALPGDEHCIFHSNNIEGKKDKFNDAFWNEFERQKEHEEKYIFIGFIFPGYISFSREVFEKDVNFLDARFLGESDFLKAQFSGATNFLDAEFSGNAYFWDAQFLGETYFENTKFFGKAYFGGAQFSGMANFLGAEFHRKSFFRDVKFEDFNQCNMINTSFYNVFGLLEYIAKNRNKFKRSKGIKYLHARCKPIFGEITVNRLPLLSREIKDDVYLMSFKKKHPAIYFIWWLLADCGRSFLRWALWSILIAVLFAFLFFSMGSESFSVSKLPFSFETMLYYSVVTFTTLGFCDVIPNTVEASRLVMIEVILGYIMLGGLISIFANKLARRS